MVYSCRHQMRRNIQDKSLRSEIEYCCLPLLSPSYWLSLLFSQQCNKEWVVTHVNEYEEKVLDIFVTIVIFCEEKKKQQENIATGVLHTRS